MNGFVLLTSAGALHTINGDRSTALKPLAGEVHLASAGRWVFAVNDEGTIANLSMDGMVRHDGEVKYTGISTNGPQLAVIAAPRGIVLIEAATLEDDIFVEADDDVTAVALRDDVVYAALITKAVRCFDPESGEWREVVRLPFVAHTLQVVSDDCMLAVGATGLARIDGRRGSMRVERVQAPGLERIAAVSHAAGSVFVGTEEGGVFRYDVTSRTVAMLGKVEGAVTSLAAHDDWLAVGSANSVRLFATPTAKASPGPMHKFGAAQLIACAAS